MLRILVWYSIEYVMSPACRYAADQAVTQKSGYEDTVYHMKTKDSGLPTAPAVVNVEVQCTLLDAPCDEFTTVRFSLTHIRI